MLLINVKTEAKLNLSIQAIIEDYEHWKWILWEQEYTIKNQTKTTVVLALPGLLGSISFRGTKNASALVDYIFIYDDVKSNHSLPQKIHAVPIPTRDTLLSKLKPKSFIQ